MIDTPARTTISCHSASHWGRPIPPLPGDAGGPDRDGAVEPTTASGGVEWFVDAEGCRPEALRDLAALRRLCDAVVRELELHVVGEPQWHQFPGAAGVTAVLLLRESHLALHTFPESGL